MAEVDGLAHATWAPLVGETFRVRAPDGQEADFVLHEARDLSETMRLPEGYKTPFSLLFRAPTEVQWPQGTFTFEHEGIGPVSLFCSAIVDPEGHGRHAYEVVVS